MLFVGFNFLYYSGLIENQLDFSINIFVCLKEKNSVDSPADNFSPSLSFPFYYSPKGSLHLKEIAFNCTFQHFLIQKIYDAFQRRILFLLAT
ncbi:hypothetical protein D1835_10695 [Enterococcus asini]|nr:hypothetical protein [Enterococcus asini]